MLIFVIFCHFASQSCENMQTMWRSIFWSAFGMCSIQTLVKIYNKWLLKNKCNPKHKFKKIGLIVNIKNTFNLSSADRTVVFSGMNNAGTVTAEVGVAARRKADLVLGLVRADNALICLVWKFKQINQTMTIFLMQFLYAPFSHLCYSSVTCKVTLLNMPKHVQYYWIRPNRPESK